MRPRPRPRPHPLPLLVALLAALVLVPLVPPASASADMQGLTEARDQVRQGRELYLQGCAGCHGMSAGGTQSGPSLYGAGAASAHFYLSTGYMPLADPSSQPRRSDPSYTQEEIGALVAYVASLGEGGPEIPDVDPALGEVSEGRALFVESCAGCHHINAEGGAFTGGYAPPLDQATPTQIGEAIRVGPYLMPVFGEGVISDPQIDSIAAYVIAARDPADPGGWGIGHIGPIPEGMVAWLIGGLALILVARVLGERT